MEKNSNYMLDVVTMIGLIYEDHLDQNCCEGVHNIYSMATIAEAAPAIPGEKIERGIITLRGSGRRVSATIACGKQQIRDIELFKFVRLIESMFSEGNETVLLRNCMDEDGSKSGRGQILGRINPASACIQIMQGLAGRVVRGAKDIVISDSYYLDRTALLSVYLTAKVLIRDRDKLESLLCYDGWRDFDIPLFPHGKPLA